MKRHHIIDYIELSVTDLEASKAFYSQAFDWSFNDYGPEYSGIQGEEREMGGLAKSETVTPGGPLVVLYSDDLESTLGLVRNAGGVIDKDIFSFPGGRRFHFKDPSGNVLAVWTLSKEE